MKFRLDLVHKGEAGGKEAGSLLQQAIRAQIATLGVPRDCQIIVRALGDLEDLTEHCRNFSINDPGFEMQSFTRGLTKSNALFDFIDTEDSYDKLSGAWKCRMSYDEC